jgi:PII-like signaling protein
LRHSRRHTGKILRLSEDLPMVIKLVNSKERIDKLMPRVDKMVAERLVTLENVRVIRYRGDDDGQP